MIRTWKPGADVMATWKAQRINYETGEVGENVKGENWRPPSEYRTDYNFGQANDRGKGADADRQDRSL